MAEQVSTTIESPRIPPMRFPVSGIPYDQYNPAWAKVALGRLSTREREILPMVAARWTDREIADVLCISYRTVTTHVTHIFDKLGVNSRREAVAILQIAGGAIE